MSDIKLISIKPSTRAGKKWMAEFNDGTITHFGALGYSDYTMHRDPLRRLRYISRHIKEDWTKPKSAGTLSRFILWEKPTIEEGIKYYKKLFKMT